MKKHGRKPGLISDLSVSSPGKRKVHLSFHAAGTDGSKPPGARRYLVKQSRRPIRTKRQFSRAHSLCKGKCSFKITDVGAPLTLKITDLHRRARYYYAVRALDNVTGRVGAQ